MHLRNTRLSIHIGSCLIIQTTFELSALTGQLLRIQRQVLTAGRRSRNRLETRYIVRAAEFTSAYTESSDKSGLLSSSDLLHLDTDTEFLGKDLDQLTEIHSSVCDIIKYRLGSVTLELHITDLHLQAKLGSNLTRADHCLMLTCNSLLPSFNIKELSLTVYPLEFVSLRIDLLTLHLASDNRSFQRNDTQIVAIGSLDNHKITGLDTLSGSVLIDSLTGILEADFKKLIILLLIHAFKPIVHFQLAAALTISALKFSTLRAFYHTSP